MIARVAERLQTRRVETGQGPVAPTRRGTLVLAFGVLLYAAGANVSSGWTLLLAGGCIGAVGWSMVVVRRAVREVTARRDLPAVATVGEPADVALAVEGADSVAVLVADTSTRLVGVLDRGRTTLHGTARLSRGWHGTTPLVLRVTDPLGLAGSWRHQQDDAAVLALPATQRHLSRTRTPEGGGGDPDGEAMSRSRARGPELVGLREHVRGDALSAVHWRASARRGELVTRDTRETAQTRRDVVFAPGSWDADRLDIACEIAVEIAETGAVEGQPVTICADGVRMPWSPAARAHLAALPPAAGVAPRPLHATERDPEADQVDLLQSRRGVAARGTGFGDQTVAVAPPEAVLTMIRLGLAPPGFGGAS